MENNQKKPASVITTIVIYVLIIFMGAFTLADKESLNLQVVVGVLFFPALFGIGLLGLFLKKNWARIFNSVLILVFGLLCVSLPFFSQANSEQFTALLIFTLIMFGFLMWWFYTVAFGSASKEYYSSRKST